MTLSDSVLIWVPDCAQSEDREKEKNSKRVRNESHK